MDNYGINTRIILLVTLLATILTAVVVVGLQAFYYFYTTNPMGLGTGNASPTKYESILIAQETGLTNYRILDQEKGIVAIPIRRAMELVVDELAHTGTEPDAAETEFDEEEYHDE